DRNPLSLPRHESRHGRMQLARHGDGAKRVTRWMCLPGRSWVALPPAFLLVVVGGIVINRAEELQDVELFPAPDILSKSRIDRIFFRLVRTDTLGFDHQTVIKSEIGCHV